jgi:hypothetical protein
MRILNVILLLVALFACVGFSGCATEPENISERPWNAPMNWETGLPAGMMNPRY